MHAFLVLAGRNGLPIDTDLTARMVSSSANLPFVPDTSTTWSNPAGTTVFLGWQAFTHLAGVGSHWAHDRDGLTAFSGFCWPEETGWDHASGLDWGRQLRQWLRQRDPLEARESLFGQFDLVQLRRDGSGIVTRDFLCAEPLYLAEGDGYVAISNRAGLCARAVTQAGSSPSRSLTGAGWIICHGAMLDEETGYWDVQRLPFGCHLAIDPIRGVTVVHPLRSPLVPDDRAAYPEVLDLVDQHLRTTLRVIAKLPISDLQFQLSGGKDSRLLLALVIDEGLRDRFNFITYGPPDKADPLVARQLAERYGLDWRLTDHLGRTPAEEEQEVRTHTSLVEGTISAWDSAGPTTFVDGAMVTGLAGEYLRFGRRGLEGAQVSSSAELLVYLLSRTNLDPLGVLRPDVKEYYVRLLSGWALDHLERGEEIDRIGSFYLAESLLRTRFGPMRSITARMAFYPYVTRRIVQANHLLPSEERSLLRLQVDLIRRCDVPLSKLPFAEKSWDAAGLAHLPDAEDYLQVQPAQSASSLAQNFRLVNYPSYRPMLDRYLLDRANPIHELIDYDRLVDRIERGNHNAGRTRRVWAVLTAAIWMGHHETPARIEPA